jgi:hypothetical protein
MAPEVIEHRPYDEKADVFSFAVVLWELLTCKVLGRGGRGAVNVGGSGGWGCCCSQSLAAGAAASSKRRAGAKPHSNSSSPPHPPQPPTPQIPYSDMTPLQAAVGVVQKGLRPALPQNCPPALCDIMEACWAGAPGRRPTFQELTPRLQALLEAARDDEARRLSSGSSGGPRSGLLSKLNLRGSGGGGFGGAR